MCLSIHDFTKNSASNGKLDLHFKFFQAVVITKVADSDPNFNGIA